jgi:hypothetical protein
MASECAKFACIAIRVHFEFLKKAHDLILHPDTTDTFPA